MKGTIKLFSISTKNDKKRIDRIEDVFFPY